MNLKNTFKGEEEGIPGVIWIIVLPSVIGGLFIIFSLSLILTNKIDFLHNLYNNNPVTFLSIAIPLIGGIWATIALGIVQIITSGGNSNNEYNTKTLNTVSGVSPQGSAAPAPNAAVTMTPQ